MVALSSEGALSLAVTRDGATVLEPGVLGIRTQQADLTSGLVFQRRSERRVVERYRTTVGKRLDRTNVMTEATFGFRNAAGARVELVVRVALDGVAYRYVLPADLGPVLGETSTFAVPGTAPAWLAKYRRDYENPFLPSTAADAATGEYMHPALFQVGGSYLLISESDVDGRYSGGRLLHDAGSGTYRIGLWDTEIAVSGPLATPWRTMIVGSLATITESTLVDDLAPRSKIGDTSWIRPGAAVWTWLAGGRSVQQSLPAQKAFVDYAAKHGWPYVLVDAGWYDDPSWRQTSWMPELVRYAKARHVDILTWIRFSTIDTPEEWNELLPLWHRWGIKGLKIDFMDSDGQERYRWYDQILPVLARERLLVNFHGATLPHGIHRTWPNVMTVEAVHGSEKSSGVTTSHILSLPFTRNVVGSMDYTPMAFQRESRPTSDAHELALSVLMESGLQDFAGTVEAYEARPLAEWYLDQVPTVWDETRLVSGGPASSAVMARRSGARWFVGGGVSGAARTLEVPLSFVRSRSRTLVEVVRDGPSGLVRERHVVPPGGSLSVPVVAEGGFAAIACEWKAGLSTCAGPVNGMPSAAMSVTPAGTKLTPGSTYAVGATFTAHETVRDVVLVPRVPSGWTVAGVPAKRSRLAAGESMSGRWTVTVGAVPVGLTEVPVVAAFTSMAGLRFENERATRVHVWRPLPADSAYVTDRPFTVVENGLGPAETDLSNGESAAGDGVTLTVGGTRFGRGLGVHAPSTVTVALDGKCSTFAASVGVDDEVDGRVDRALAGGTVSFAVLGDGVVLAETGVLRTTDPAHALNVDVRGVHELTLRVTDGGDDPSLDHASWGDALVRCS